MPQFYIILKMKERIKDEKPFMIIRNIEPRININSYLIAVTFKIAMTLKHFPTSF